jgi:hypothetical protein
VYIHERPANKRNAPLYGALSSAYNAPPTLSYTSISV